MRILFASLIEGLWGGSEILWSRTALAAKAAGHEVSAFFPYYKDIIPTRNLATAGIRLHFGTARPTRWWLRIGQRPKNRDLLFRSALHAENPELVVINQGSVRDGLAEMHSCRQNGIDYVIVNQAVEPLAYPDATWRELRAAYSGAKAIWCVSAENLADLRAYLCLPLPQAQSITNAYACPYAPDSNWPACPPYKIAVVGRLDPSQKGQDLLLDALAEGSWNEQLTRFPIFGEGPAKEQLEARKQKLGLHFVDITGNNSAVADIWRTHHALLQPSRFEGQSLAMLEAMLHARPVICTPVGGTHGVVIDGHTGFLADSCNDRRSLSQLLDRAWNAREQWQQMGISARTHVLKLVSPNPGEDFLEKLSACRKGCP